MKANASRSHKRLIHTVYQQPKNVARVFPFIFKAKHKTLHVIWPWVELEILQKKHYA